MTINDKLLKLLTEIQCNVENLPMGGIGKDGPTQSELDEASGNYRPIENDSAFHIGQQVWLLAEDAKKILNS